VLLGSIPLTPECGKVGAICACGCAWSSLGCQKCTRGGEGLSWLSMPPCSGALLFVDVFVFARGGGGGENTFFLAGR
jgi:hypothetical protein